VDQRRSANQGWVPLRALTFDGNGKSKNENLLKMQIDTHTVERLRSFAKGHSRARNGDCGSAASDQGTRLNAYAY